MSNLLFVIGVVIVIFTGASVLCATASSLGEMIVYRAMQGFCGGAITPGLSFAVVISAS